MDDESGTQTKPQPVGWRANLRWLWTQLTSMRTALFLLFLLAVAAIPGSIVPQRTVSRRAVMDYAAENPQLDKIFEPLGMYDVYTSVWFSAIYLLLMISLIGCIIPRITLHAKALRKPPPPIPSRLDRLGAFESRTTSLTSVSMVHAETWLSKHRYRVKKYPGGLSAERGLSRETGNLVFHLAAVVLLIGVAWTNLLGFRGQALIIEDQSFSNTITQYDQMNRGAWFDVGDLTPFSVTLDSFQVEFETSQVQQGSAREFLAEVTIDANGTQSEERLQVNRPLNIDGTEVHLLGHGYAPDVTVTDADGNVAFAGPVPFLPQDSNFTSTGVINAVDARPERIAFQGFFLPTAVIAERGPESVFPDALNPEVVLNVWTGPPKEETGVPESVYSLDTDGLSQVETDGKPLALRLAVGDSYDLPGGGSITFDGWQRWIQVQISRTPGLWFSVAAIAAGVAGLCFSLFVRPRRLWVRETGHGHGMVEIEVAGLDRTDTATGLDDDVAGLLAAATSGEDSQ